MKPTVDKCHILVKTEKSVSISIGRINVKNKMEQKLLGIEFYLSLSFEGHMLSLCKNKDLSKSIFISKNSQLYGPS